MKTIIIAIQVNASPAQGEAYRDTLVAIATQMGNNVIGEVLVTSCETEKETDAGTLCDMLEKD